MLTLEGGEIIAKTPFSAKDDIKLVKGGRWRPGPKVWAFPASPLIARKLTDVVGRFGVAPEVEDLASTFVTVPDIIERIGDGERVDVSDLLTFPPRSNQVVGALMLREMAGSLLGWGMGSGKTYAMISAICDLIDRARADGVTGCLGKVFIAAPSTVVRGVWPGEFRKHMKDWSRHVELSAMPKGTSTAKRVSDARRKIKSAERTGKLAVVIVSIDSCIYSTVSDFVKEHEWDIGCIDEIHRCATPGAKITRWLDTVLAPRSRKRVGLTGTLFRNHEIDAFCPVRFVEPGLLGRSAAKFRDDFASMNPFGGVTGVKASRRQELLDLIGLVTHTVKTRDVVDLPPINPMNHVVELGKEGREQYDKMARDSVLELSRGVLSADNRMTVALRLHQIASGFLRYESTDGQEIGVEVDTSKRKALTYILEQLPDDEPVVVFTVYRSDVETVRGAAMDADRQCFELSGSVDELEMWQQAEGGQVIAANIRSAGVGIDLTRAAYAVFYSCGYSRADYDQAVSRIDRPGQTRSMTVVHIVAQDTVDEAVIKALGKKGDTIEAAIAYLQSQYGKEGET
jgi:SNF2 family DNA or RNA helicase